MRNSPLKYILTESGELIDVVLIDYSAANDAPTPLELEIVRVFNEWKQLQAENKKLKAENEKLQTENAGHKRHISLLQMTDDSSVRVIEEMDTEIEKLKVELETRNAQIEPQKDRIGGLQAELEKHRWIPVSERMPEKETNVWISNGKEVEEGYLDNRWHGARNWREECGIEPVTHWKPIILP